MSQWLNIMSGLNPACETLAVRPNEKGQPEVKRCELLTTFLATLQANSINTMLSQHRLSALKKQNTQRMSRPCRWSRAMRNDGI